MQSNSGSPRLEVWIRLGGVAALAILSAILTFDRLARMQLPHFWDAHIVVSAARYVAGHRNPYLASLTPSAEFPFPFIYPPAAAMGFGFLSVLFGSLLKPVLVVLHLLAVGIVPLILTRLCFPAGSSRVFYGYGLFIGGLGGFGLVSLTAGNLAAVLYFAILLGLSHALKSGRWAWFHAAVLTASLVKPPYLFFLIVPVLIYGFSWRQAAYALANAAAVVAVYALTRMLDYPLFQDWLAALFLQVQTHADYGFSIAAAPQTLGLAHRPVLTGFLVHIVAMGLLGLTLLLGKTGGRTRLAGLIAFAIFANPRMKEYDLPVAAVAVAALIEGALAGWPATDKRRAAVRAGFLALMLVLLVANGLRRQLGLEEASNLTLMIGSYAAVMTGALLSATSRKAWTG